MLFGGWQIDFQFGYQVPSEEFMSTVDGSSDYLLRVPFSHPWENAHTENLTTKIILPEGAQNIRVNIPFSIDDVHLERTQRLLDPFGRPMIVLSHRNAVGHHNQDIEVLYSFSHMAILFEPLTIAVLIFLGLLTARVYAGLDLRLDPYIQPMSDPWPDQTAALHEKTGDVSDASQVSQNAASSGPTKSSAASESQNLTQLKKKNLKSSKTKV
jgi:hypothetical protein